MRPIELAVCGFGLVGKRHVEAARHLSDVSVTGVAELSVDGRAAAERAGLRSFDNLDALLNDTRPDGVIIATPTPLHREHALAAITQACPVLVEKPIAATTAEARDITAAALAAKVPVLVGHHRRYNPLIEKARDLITSGRIGAVRGVQATCWFYKPDAYFDAAPWRKEPGAGPISVNLVHDVDLIRHLCGEVARVSAMAVPARRGYANEDLAAAVLTLVNGAVATISVSDSIVAPWSWEFTSGENPVYPKTAESCYLIGGTHGALSVPDLKVWTHEGGRQDWWSPISAEAAGHETSDPLVNQIRHFRDVIRGMSTPRVSAEEGLRSLEVVEAIGLSVLDGGRVVSLPPRHDPP
jgi:predicted dehydrogenase